MAFTYNDCKAQLANFLTVPETDANFLLALPTIIQDAENRLYRELDMMEAKGTATTTLVAGQRSFFVPQYLSAITFRTIEQMNVITPSSTTDPELGTRNPLEPASKEVLDALWPSATGSGVPTLFAPISQTQWIVGPWPDEAYTMEVYGTFQPEPLSESTQNTILTLFFPDVFFAACMVMSAGYQMNFSSMSDNPAQAMSWETHVQTLLNSAKVQEMRRRFGSEGWTSLQPDPVASPPRT